MRGRLRTMLMIWCAAGCGASEDADAGVDAARPVDAAPPMDADSTGSDANGAAPDAAVPRPDGGSATSGTSPYFPAGSWYLEDVEDAPKAAHSDRAIQALRARGGWGNGDLFQIDFSIDVLVADQATAKREFTPRTEENGYDEEFYSPDCDQVAVPLPSGGNLEGEDDYACSSDGDCHLIVWDAPARKLYEMWRADISGARFLGGCLAVWNGSRALTASGRGLQCSSADAAGFPIAPLLFTADEVHAGAIEHAIRFILPNDRPRRGFVPPATHGTGTTGPEGAPYYGVHLRLRADFPLESLPNEGARVVARALSRFGMYHADGGNIALTAQSDRHTQHKWSGLLGPRDLRSLRVEDFEVIDHGAPIELTYDCTR